MCRIMVVRYWIEVGGYVPILIVIVGASLLLITVPNLQKLSIYLLKPADPSTPKTLPQQTTPRCKTNSTNNNPTPRPHNTNPKTPNANNTLTPNNLNTNNPYN
jgi:hypothetical protein